MDGAEMLRRLQAQPPAFMRNLPVATDFYRHAPLLAPLDAVAPQQNRVLETDLLAGDSDEGSGIESSASDGEEERSFDQGLESDNNHATILRSRRPVDVSEREDEHSEDAEGDGDAAGDEGEGESEGEGEREPESDGESGVEQSGSESESGDDRWVAEDLEEQEHGAELRPLAGGLERGWRGEGAPRPNIRPDYARPHS